VQETYGIPPGCLTEGTLELNHKMFKKYQKKASLGKSLTLLSLTVLAKTIFLLRNNSYKSQNQDIMVRCSWTSDPLLLWESEKGQKIKPGYMRTTEEKTEESVEPEGSKESEETLEAESEYEMLLHTNYSSPFFVQFQS